MWTSRLRSFVFPVTSHAWRLNGSPTFFRAGLLSGVSRNGGLRPLSNGHTDAPTTYVPAGSRRLWTKEEDNLVKKLRDVGLGWEAVSEGILKHTGIVRTPRACHQRYIRTAGGKTVVTRSEGPLAAPVTLIPARASRLLSEQEDDLLKQARKEGLSWETVSKRIAEKTGVARTIKACQNRYCYFLKADKPPPRPKADGFMPKQAWTSQEDDTLQTLRSKVLSWVEIGIQMQRTALSCKRRYRFIVLENPSLFEPRPWTYKEDHHILAEVAAYSQRAERPKWTEIGKPIGRVGEVVYHRYQQRLVLP